MTHAPFAARLTRSPLAHDRAACADVAGSFGDLAPEVAGLLGAVAGCSPYLKGLMSREGDWLRGALSGPPEAAMAAVLA
ncbi:MAG: hypothetical protein O9292_14785, partial [Rhodobacteraceae bacterium]|nr:hypothetical protein [Paracoccaceae bacterium]